MLPDGANDGGSGTAIMLEIARLTKDANLDLGIDFFFFRWRGNRASRT